MDYKEVNIIGLTSEDLAELLTFDDVNFIQTKHTALDSSDIGDFGLTIVVLSLTYGAMIALITLASKSNKDININIEVPLGLKISFSASKENDENQIYKILSDIKKHHLLDDENISKIESELRKTVKP